MKFFRFVYPLALSLFVFFLILQSNVNAFAVKSHVHIANEALAAARELETKQNVPMAPHVSEALKKFPAAFRAGTLGPDVFPDFIAGQVWVHANHGKEAGLAGDIPLEQRESVSEWRSIDYGMYMLKRAHDYHDELQNDEGLKAIAFAYGYLSHMVGDGFAHSFVNEWSGGAFALTEGRMEEYPVLEEIRHWAIESLLDDVLPIDSKRMKIDAPSHFLFRIMTEEVVIQDAQGNDISIGPRGAFGGDYYVKLVELRDKFRRWKNSKDWDESSLVDWLVEAQDVMSKISTAGTDIGNPITDLEHIMGKRAEIFDSFLEEWIWLSECSAQNLLLNEVNGVAPRDACRDVNFEPDGSDLGSLYGGKLNEAAHTLNGDPRDLRANVERMVLFVETATKEILAFDMVRDVGSHKALKDVQKMCAKVVEWGSCENACESATNACSDVIGGAVCYSNFCPQSNNKFTCSGGWSFYCGFINPSCQFCAGKLVDAVAGGFCAAAVNAGSAEVCTLCDQAPICGMMDGVDAMHELLSDGVKSVLWDLYESEVKDYVQKHVSPKMLEQLQRLEELVAMQSLARDAGDNKNTRFWMLNQTYFSEDIIVGGRAWLDTLFNTALGLYTENLQRVETKEEFIDLTWAAMSPSKRYLWVGGPKSARAAYEEFIDNLWRLQSSSSWARPLRPVKPSFWFELSILSNVPEGQRGSRYAKLLDDMELIVEQPGPTASYFLSRMVGLPMSDIDDPFSVEADLFKFEPAYNSITLTRNSLFPMFNISMPSHNTSSICGQQPHVLCDGIASLDDPNNLGTKYLGPIWMPRRPDIPGSESSPSARDYSVGWNNSGNQRFPSDPLATFIANRSNPARGDNLKPSEDLEWVYRGVPENSKPIYILPENIDLEIQPLDRSSILNRYPRTLDVNLIDLMEAWKANDEETIASIIEPKFPELPPRSLLAHSKERSVYAWYSMPIVWEPGYLGPSRQWNCRYGTTEFSLAHSEAHLDSNYLPVFVPHYEECVAKPKMLTIDDARDIGDWDVDGGVIRFNPDRLTGGDGSMDVCVRGSTSLRSPEFNTADFGQVGDRLRMDVFAPRRLDTASYAEVILEMGNAGSYSLGRRDLAEASVVNWNRLEWSIDDDLLAELQKPDRGGNRVLIELGGFGTGAETCVGVDGITYSGGPLKPQNAANLVTRGLPVPEPEPDSGDGAGLLSFENLADWRSEQTAIRQDFTRFTDGKASLAIKPNNFTYIRSRLFRPSELGAKGSKIKLDMLIPLQQPNPHWIGQAQLFLSCPSAGVNNAFLGFQDLTNLAKNQFVPLTFNLGSAEQAALNSSSNDCSFSFALNANVGAGEFLVDKMRFAN